MADTAEQDIDLYPVRNSFLSFEFERLQVGEAVAGGVTHGFDHI